MLVRWTDFDDAFRALDLFPDTRGLWSAAPRRLQAYAPYFHVSEAEDALTLTAELPGLGDKDVQIGFERGVLEIKAERETTAPEGFKRLAQERSAFKLQKRFTLPDTIDVEKIDASMKDGILTLRLPKTEAAKPKTIAVRGV